MRRATASSALTRAVLLTLVWMALIEFDPGYLAYGLAAVPLAVWVSLQALPAADRSGARRGGAQKWLTRVVPAVRLIGWVAWQTVRGGVDVARRALARPVRVDPVEVRIEVDLDGGARAFALGVYGLMPGTIAMAIGERDATVHTLSAELDAVETCTELQRRVAAVINGDQLSVI
ncbi:MAG: Na+/H+ antiporter subunit E [Actinomycetia bacterium]|nr:Na+/H+ antiporter subunit E [Actinomycetes bacterium]